MFSYESIKRINSDAQADFNYWFRKNYNQPKINIGLQFKGLDLEEMLKSASKVRKWDFVKTRYYSISAKEWLNCEGYEGISKEIVFQIVKNLRRVSFGGYPGDTISGEVTEYCLQALHNRKKIGVVTIMGPIDYEHQELHDFFEIYNTLEEERETRERERKGKNNSFQFEDWRQYLFEARMQRGACSQNGENRRKQ